MRMPLNGFRRADALSDQPGNQSQKNCQQEEGKAADKETSHPGAAGGLGEKGKSQRHKPHQEGKLE